MGKYIGDYIHYKWDNYIKYGTSRNEKDSSSIGNAYRETHKMMLNIANQAKFNGNLQSMQDEMNKFLADYSIKNPVTGINYSEMEKDLTEAISSELGKNVTNINFNTLSPNALTEFLNTIDAPSTKVKKQVTNSQIEKLYQKFTNIRSLLLDKINSGKLDTLSYYQYMKIHSQIMDIQKTLNHFYEEINLKGKSEYFSGNKTYYKDAINGYINAIDSFKQIKIENSIPSKTEIGIVGEYTTAYILAKIKGMSDSQVKNMLKMSFDHKNYPNNPTGVVGNQVLKTSISRLSGNLIDSDALSEHLGRWEKKINTDAAGNPTGGYTIVMSDFANGKPGGSQQTIDIQFNFSLNTGDEIRASVKNYNNGIDREIKVLEGSPLFGFLDLGTVIFWNHYLNILTHIGYASGDQSNLSDEGIKEMIITRGTVGARTNAPNSTKMANLFIVHDTSIYGGGYTIFDYGTLLTNILNNVDDYTKIENLPLCLLNHYVNNTFNKLDYESAMQRISSIILELHRYKISASLINLKNLKQTI